MEELRPDPEELLRKINIENEEMKRGKLKIFFGYAAGVGKTYAMLDAAHSAKKAGVDVVAGYVEPHARPETIGLLKGLEVLDTLKVDYKGITLKEFDLDGALKRHPELILVDELAHTNAEGCRHVKRYDDVEELLNAGIDVYTTVNVQHIESLNDIVASITQVIVKERVPDTVFDRASQVELVDIEPDDLMLRLNEGKIYKENQAKRALNHFFTKENLVALREIALRRTADRVNRQVEDNKASNKAKEYFTNEHILVCLSSSPSNSKVIRTAARMANVFHASLTALFVETEDTGAEDESNRQRLRENIKLAGQLGARIATVYGDDLAYQIAEYAKVSSISKIVVGRSNNKGNFLSQLLGRGNNFVEKLTNLAPNLDVYIIPDQNGVPYKKKRRSMDKGINMGDLLKTLFILSVCTAVGLIFRKIGFSEANVITIYILGVLLIANQTNGKSYGIISSIGVVFTFNFFFTDPRFSFQAYDSAYPVTFAVMMASSLITSTLTRRVKMQAKSSAINAHRTEILLETSRRLLRADDFNSIIRKSSEQLIKLLGLPIILYTVKDGKLTEPETFHNVEGEKLGEEYTFPDEVAVATWVFHNKKVAGASTDTLPGSKALYMPILSKKQMLGVIGVVLNPGEIIEPFEKSILVGMLTEISFAIDKYNLNVEREESSIQAEKEHLRANLLRAISHDLRTPLTSISGNASVLYSDDGGLEEGVRKKLAEDIYDDSLWLINLVENLLAVTRIEDGNLDIETQPEVLEDILNEAVSHIQKRIGNHTLKVHAQEDLFMVLVDTRMMIQVFINIIDNAVKYTKEDSTIEITVSKEHGKAIIEIADNGRGISDDDKKHIFNMFYTANEKSSDSRRGLGLGLALCKSIVDAHKGEIYVKDNPGGGTIFGVKLKITEVKTFEE